MIMENEISVNVIHIERSRTRGRESPHQEIGPVTVRAPLIVLDKDIVPDYRRGGPVGHAGKRRDRKLVFDFHVVTYRVRNQVVLDDAVNARLSSVRIAQIDSCARSQNLVVTDYPSPSRRFRGNSVRLLARILADKRIAFDPYVMGQIVFVPSR